MTSIDIILPYYNGSKYIKEQLESIKSSDLEGIDLRIIILNDASNEEETQFLEKNLPDNCLYIKNETNLGLKHTIEKGLKISTAPYIMLCDQDDVWLRHKIKKSLLKILEIEGDKPSLVYTDLIIVGSNLETQQPSMHKYYKHRHDLAYPSILFHNIITGCTIIMNRKLLEIALPFPERITVHDHWIAICAVFSGNAAYLGEKTILYRQHGNNLTGAPRDSLILRLIKFRKTKNQFNVHTAIKTEMATSLYNRLVTKKSMPDQELLFLEKIIEALEVNDFIFLINAKVITGSLIRVLGLATLLCLQKKG